MRDTNSPGIEANQQTFMPTIPSHGYFRRRRGCAETAHGGEERETGKDGETDEAEQGGRPRGRGKTNEARAEKGRQRRAEGARPRGCDEKSEVRGHTL